MAVGVAFMVAAMARPAWAQTTEVKNVTPPSTDPDEVLRAALPENALPDLRDYLRCTMNRSSRVIAGLLDVDQATAGEKQARAPMLPNVSASGNYGVSQNRYDHLSYTVKDKNGVTQVDGNGVPVVSEAYTDRAFVRDASYNLGISQPVYYWGALRKRFLSARIQHAISSRNIEEIRRSLAMEVRSAYFALVSAANGLVVEKQTLAQLQVEREYLKKQAGDGFITPSQAGSMDTRIEDFKLQMQRSQNNFENRWRAFCDLTGMDRKTLMPTFPKEIPIISPQTGTVLANLESPSGKFLPVSLQNAEDSIRAERLNYEIISTQLLPRFGVSANASRGFHSPDTAAGFGGPYIATSYGASVSANWSIFDGFSTQASKQSSRIRIRQQERTRDQVQKDYEDTIRNNLLGLQLNWQSLQRTEEGLVAARANIETYQKDYEAGISPKRLWDDAVVAADNALYAANNARADYYLQIVNYLSLRGKDPAVNFRPEPKPSDASKK